jgi:hypothetical protein
MYDSSNEFCHYSDYKQRKDTDAYVSKVGSGMIHNSGSNQAYPEYLNPTGFRSTTEEFHRPTGHYIWGYASGRHF